MARFTKAVSAPKVNLALFIIAAALLAVACIGGTRAALTYFSDTYVARVAVSDIGVTLLENGNAVSHRNYEGSDKWSESTGQLLQNMLPSGEELKIGQSYPEALSVQNTGTIGQYVRVTVLKYWEKSNGNGEYEKVRSVSPGLIQLTKANQGDWIVDEAASTDERTVFYYTKPLEAGQTTSALSSAIAVSPEVQTKVTQTSDTAEIDGKTYTTITTTYDYDGLRFCLEAEVDAVQDHNAQSAIKSAWGKNVTIKNGKLGLA